MFSGECKIFLQIDSSDLKQTQACSKGSFSLSIFVGLGHSLTLTRNCVLYMFMLPDCYRPLQLREWIFNFRRDRWLNQMTTNKRHIIELDHPLLHKTMFQLLWIILLWVLVIHTVSHLMCIAQEHAQSFKHKPWQHVCTSVALWWQKHHCP